MSARINSSDIAAGAIGVTAIIKISDLILGGANPWWVAMMAVVSILLVALVVSVPKGQRQ